MTQENAIVDAKAQENEMALARQNLVAMGMTSEEIEAEMTRQSAARTQDKPKDQDKPVVEEDKEKVEKENAEKVAAEKKTAEDKSKADEIKDMLFKAEREKKMKERAELVKKAREERMLNTPPEELAKENEAVALRDEELDQERADNLTLKQNIALLDEQGKMSPEEWAVIAPVLQEFINSKEYDQMFLEDNGRVKAGLDVVKLTSKMIELATGKSYKKLLDLKLAKVQADNEAQKKIEDLKTFNGPKQPVDNKAQKTELEQLEELALQGKLDGHLTERMLELQGQAGAQKKRR